MIILTPRGSRKHSSSIAFYTFWRSFSLLDKPTAIAIIERAVGKDNLGSVRNAISDSSKPDA